MPIKGINFTGELPDIDVIRSEMAAGKDPYLNFVNQASEDAKAKKAVDPNYYTEVHHYIPKHAGGTDEPENLVSLSFNDHAIAHYIRWIMTGDTNDEGAFKYMINQSEEGRRAKASVAGKIGGKKAQELHRQNKTGFFNDQKQSERGKRGAETNRQNNTGAFDPKNLEKANQKAKELYETDPKFRAKRLANLQKGSRTQVAQGKNIGDPFQQRLKSWKRKGYVEVCGVKYSLDKEQRTYISDTTLELLLRYTPLKSS